MNDTNVKAATTEKSGALSSHLFLGSVTRWIAITNDYTFIMSFLAFI